ncbi:MULTISPECIES: type I restriction-modification system subunit M [unclassified Arthrobacter]|uniref:type I restriction-modification system subunit M n=1 Tax=unclassified Arthrobacter TaxID=235627 RepID=UPI0006DAE790|nr:MULTISPECIES: class I SAM-dependent DNA methyltransferase [unclassified Arthrobacter]KPN21733.1 restriction endonuclease subunit M [Arthrobacter sp. Edens01]MSR97743.1 SAM-dependent DNA methyltransferase [Arthrobacter sp. BL-252-APC-1A]
MSNHASFIWGIADLLRGNFKAHQYGDFILPFTVLRRLDSVLADTKPKVLEVVADAEAKGIPIRPVLLKSRAGHQHSFFNTSRYDLATLVGDAENLRENLLAYINAFSENVRDIFVKYKIEDRIEELEDNNLLLLVVQRFAEVDLHPQKVSNAQMGHVFEELIRKFAEASNETAGEHFTPREVIELMVDLLFENDDEALRDGDIVRSVYDPTAGTGGMLSVAEDHLTSMNPKARLTLAGQELNAQSYAICKADMVIKGQSVDAIVNDDTLLYDGHAGTTFNYCLSNPPFGVDWKKQEKTVREEHSERGFAGRFGPGLPRVSDGSMLFLLHLISKMREPGQYSAGGRAAIVLNGSPLFTGGAGSGESNIRKWVLERDYLEAIIALPTDMFYNTGISTYVWVLSKEKAPERRNKVQLVDGSKLFRKMRKGLGSKRNELGPKDVQAIVKLYGDFMASDQSKIFDTTDFLYRTITVERPLKLNFATTPDRIEAALAVKAFSKLTAEAMANVRTALETMDTGVVWKNRDEFTKALKKQLRATGADLSGPHLKALVAGLSERDDTADVCTGAKGKAEPDPDLRDTENVPWNEDIHAYVEREVKPFIDDAWIDEDKTKDGCEIPFTRHFYEYIPPRPLEVIDADLDAVLGRIRSRLEQVKA